MEYRKYIEFQIKLDTPHFFKCMVFDKKRDMEAFYFFACKEYSIKMDKDPKNEEFYACMFPFDCRTKDAKENMLGILLFCKKHLIFPTIMHEIQHAAIWYDRVVNGNKNASYGPYPCPKEEKLCDALEGFAKSFYSNLKLTRKKNGEEAKSDT